MLNRIIKSLAFVCLGGSCFAQTDSFHSKFSAPIELDSVVVGTGFDAEGFIAHMKNDTTFYKAFKSMHLASFISSDTFRVFNEENLQTGSRTERVKQVIDANHCRVNTFDDVLGTGICKSGNNRSETFTGNLFYTSFFSTEKVCHQSDIVAGSLKPEGNSRMDKAKFQLKQLIFNPGSGVSGIPLMGEKTTIFEPGQQEKYKFSITTDTLDGEPVFVFRILPRPEYRSKVVYNELTTWFRIKDYTILARRYSISYKNWIYDFDVNMYVRLTQKNGKLYPSIVHYKGNWHIATQKRENTTLRMKVTYN